jgi:hypothetical protein
MQLVTRVGCAGLVAALVPLSAACGDDDDEAQTTSGEASSTSAASSGAGGGAASSSSSGAGGAGGTAGTRVFVTSLTYQGNLGGLRGGDGECQALADREGLGGTWLAWLSAGDPGDLTPVDRLNHSTLPYTLVGGGTIADDWDDLLDGTIDSPIDRDESGSPLDEQETTAVWTGTASNGSAMGPSCTGWTTTDSGAVFGSTLATDSLWTFESGMPCTAMHRLYCFEQ